MAHSRRTASSAALRVWTTEHGTFKFLVHKQKRPRLLGSLSFDTSIMIFTKKLLGPKVGQPVSPV